MTPSLTVRLDGRTLVVTFDEPGRSANVLGRTAMRQLADAVTRAESDREVGSVLLRSAKPGVFIAGADIREIEAATDPAEFRTMIEFGQQLFERIEKLPKPVIAAINGICLGGGLELAMACHWRIAADSPATKIGLPETKLGLIPGWGGTQRLPRLVGVQRALAMILRAEQVSAKGALKDGLVDEVVGVHALDRVAAEVAAKAAETGTVPDHKGANLGWVGWALEGNPLGRSVVISQARAVAVSESRGLYPALPAAVDAVAAGLSGDREAGLKAEADGITALATGPVSRNLRRVFLLSEAAKKRAGSAPADVKFESAGVIGAGTMGAAIAAVLAAAGVRVRLRDTTEAALAKGLGRIRKIFEYDVKKRFIPATEAEAKYRRVLPTTTWTGLKHADIVIEAVLEEMDVKRPVFAELDKAVGPDCILASNTSALDIDELASVVSRPERVVGLHFFNPVEKMPLVEIVRGQQTSDATINAALSLAKKTGKVPIVVKNRPGFLINRVLGPYLAEAGRLLTETRDPKAVDKAALDFGLPMGPAELLDIIGLDVAESVVRTLNKAFGDRLAAPALFHKMIAEGLLGKKAGEGFYLHGDKAGGDAKGEALEVNPRALELINAAAAETGAKPFADGPLAFAHADAPSMIAARLVFPMIDESARLLEEGVVERADDIDLGMILGTGFAPFRGGPWKYGQTLGLENVVTQMRAWAATLGPRYEPSAELIRAAWVSSPAAPAAAEPSAAPVAPPVERVPAEAAAGAGAGAAV
jgi:3-hydroxyacyl-CoA dehydrogenase/enoyl-CoA hydratase/3-hydroxybutyryl-CoA epimerase